MATMLKEVDAVCIGVGFTGSILARELTKAGLKVVGLERGADRSTREDFTLPSVRDDLKYAVRQELFQDTQTETVTLRHSPSETALPLRRLGSFLPGTGVGGAGAHWNGVTWRLLPSDHNLRSHLQNRYGRNAIPAEMTIEDYPVSYDELEPYYDRFEKLCGISGKAGNLRGQIDRRRQRVRGARQNEYPNRPLVQTMAGSLMEKAAKELGLSPVSGALCEHERRLHQSGGRHAGRLRILRPLRALRLRGKCQGFAAGLHPAGVAAGPEIRAAHLRLCEGAGLRQAGEEGEGGASMSTPEAARNSSSPPASSSWALTCSTTCC